MYSEFTDSFDMDVRLRLDHDPISNCISITIVRGSADAGGEICTTFLAQLPVTRGITHELYALQHRLV